MRFIIDAAGSKTIYGLFLMMQNRAALRIPFISGIDQHTTINTISDLLDTLPVHPVAIASWNTFPYTPKVAFSIGHTNDALLIKYYVEEKAIRALHVAHNSPVYTDSCVEFFMMPEGSEGYYNFEFNCIGANLSGYGPNKSGRTLLPETVTRPIRRQAWLQKTKDDMISWELALAIPVQVFCYHQLTSLKGLQATANFYKCGDELPEPHFLSWMPIQAPAPNFHLPAFFGSLYFE